MRQDPTSLIRSEHLRSGPTFKDMISSLFCPLVLCVDNMLSFLISLFMNIINVVDVLFFFNMFI